MGEELWGIAENDSELCPYWNVGIMEYWNDGCKKE
jgi:hypothetical protein